MLPSYSVLRGVLRGMLYNKGEQGHELGDMYEQLKELPDSYDRMFEFGKKIAALPLREDWSYVEPDLLEDIRRESDSSRPLGLVGNITREGSQKRVEAAFLGSVCGCILGKPLEEYPFADLDAVHKALDSVGEWPMRDYVSEEMLEVYGRRNPSWVETTRGRIQYVTLDDDITYTIMGMLLLEQHGAEFTKDHIRQLWIENLPIYQTWGPERTMLLKAGLSSLDPGAAYDLDEWVMEFNPGDELCGALIRADAYGYACPGRPELAAELAWRDASWTHRRTGIYGAMFVAAVISLAQVMSDRLGIIETALKFVPQRSRFYKIASDSLEEIAQAEDWVDGYHRIHYKYEMYTACRVYQEIGTLINTLRFAEDIGDGICKQVSQGNDTDSFGATAGSILGAYFGPGFLESRWIEPFQDTIYTTLCTFKETRLSKVVKRMGQLPVKIGAGDLGPGMK